MDQVQGVFGRGPIISAGPGPPNVPLRGLECRYAGPGPRGKSGPSPNGGWTRSGGAGKGRGVLFFNDGLIVSKDFVLLRNKTTFVVEKSKGRRNRSIVIIKSKVILPRMPCSFVLTDGVLIPQRDCDHSFSKHDNNRARLCRHNCTRYKCQTRSRSLLLESPRR